MIALIANIGSKELLLVSHDERSWSGEREPEGRSPTGGEGASSFQSHEQLIDHSQSMIHMTFAIGCHSGYSFYRNAVRILYLQLDLSELPNFEMDIEDALMQLRKK